MVALCLGERISGSVSGMVLLWWRHAVCPSAGTWLWVAIVTTVTAAPWLVVGLVALCLVVHSGSGVVIAPSAPTSGTPAPREGGLSPGITVLALGPPPDVVTNILCLCGFVRHICLNVLHCFVDADFLPFLDVKEASDCQLVAMPVVLEGALEHLLVILGPLSYHSGLITKGKCTFGHQTLGLVSKNGCYLFRYGMKVARQWLDMRGPLGDKSPLYVAL